MNDWAPIAVAIIALLGTLYTGRAVRKVSKQPDIVGQAGQVSGLAVGQMQRMGEEIERLEAEVDDLRNRIRLLEAEVIRLGGDPGLVLAQSRQT